MHDMDLVLVILGLFVNLAGVLNIAWYGGSMTYNHWLWIKSREYSLVFVQGNTHMICLLTTLHYGY